MFNSNSLSTYLPELIVITLTNFRGRSLSRGCYWDSVMHKIVKGMRKTL